MQTLSYEKRNANYKLKIATNSQILFKLYRVKAVDDTDKLSKFNKNLTTNADCIT